MSVDKGSKKRLDLKTLAAMVGLDRARDDDACLHRESIFARLPPDAYDSPAIDLHDKLAELLDAARSITPDTGTGGGNARKAARDGELPKFLSRALDDYIIGTIAAGADASAGSRDNGTAPAPSVPASRPVRQRIRETFAAVSTIAVFCAFGASVGTLSALGFAPRQNDAAYATMAKGLSIRTVTPEELVLRRLEFVAPDRCADGPCPKLTLRLLPPAEPPPMRAKGAALDIGGSGIVTSIREPDAASIVRPDARAVAVAEPSPPIIAVQEALPSVEVATLEPVLPAPDGFDALSAVVLRGLPAGSTLSAGRKLSDTEWTLSAGDLNNVVITFPENVPPRFRATVELIRRGGQPATTLNLEIRHAPGSRSVPLAAIAKDTRVADEASETTKPARKVARAPSQTAKPAPKPKKPRTVAAKSAPQPPRKPAAPQQAALVIRQPRDLDAGAQIQHSLGAPVWGPPAPGEGATPTLFGLLFGEPQDE